MPRDTDYHLMGKRRFMKALSKLGLSATAVSQMSKSTLAKLTDDPKKEVPRVKHVSGPAIDHDPEDGFVDYEDAEVEYYTIPRDEWEVYAEPVRGRPKVASAAFGTLRTRRRSCRCKDPPGKWRKSSLGPDQRGQT